MSSSISVSDICDWFFVVEREHNLFAREEQGCFFWRCMRISTYYALTEALELFGKAHPEQAVQANGIWARRWLLVRDALLRNPFFSSRHSDAVLMPHNRRLVAGKDIYRRRCAQACRNQIPLCLGAMARPIRCKAAIIWRAPCFGTG